MRPPRLPDYDTSTLADLLPSLGDHLGVPGAVDRLGLPPAERYLVALVDGLGHHQLNDYAEHAPYLSGLIRRVITSGAAAPHTGACS